MKVLPTTRDDRAGGCSFVINPERDAREVEPRWIEEQHKLVRLIPMDNIEDNRTRFDLWKFPGNVSLSHDGRNLCVCARTSTNRFWLELDHALVDGCSFGYALPANQWLSESQRVVSELSALLVRAGERSHRESMRRPSRATIYHLRTLQALDGASCGASQRDIANVILGEDVVAEQWNADSAIRAHVRVLIHRGRTLLKGGYTRLLSAGHDATQGGIG